MRKLSMQECEELDGAWIAAAMAIVGIALLAVSTVKVALSNEAKVKLPGGFEVGFDNPDPKASESAKWNNNISSQGTNSFSSSATFGLLNG